MIRSELVDALAERLPHLSIKDSDAAVRVVFEVMAQSLLLGHRVEIRRFGSFSLSHRKARVGRNPRTGESVCVPAKRAVHFKPGKDLRDSVDQAAKVQPHAQTPPLFDVVAVE